MDERYKKRERNPPSLLSTCTVKKCSYLLRTVVKDYNYTCSVMVIVCFRWWVGGQGVGVGDIAGAGRRVPFFSSFFFASAFYKAVPNV